MNENIDGRKVANQVAARLSLRTPQQESLEILVDLLEKMSLTKDPDLQAWLAIAKRQFPTVHSFTRNFPSLCFALATGVGKTRLMGAMIAWLYITGRSRHFLVLAPNLTIFEKLKQDFTIGNPKYVFAGIPEFAQAPPVIVTGDDYVDGRGVRLDYAVPETLTGDLFGADSAPHINIFNIAKINARDVKQGSAKSSVAKVRRYQEYLGESYFDYLSNLPDLVVLMDEAHRYYASAGAQAINDLRPVLGIELTATPKTVGTNAREFSNIVYHYPLARALKDGYVKIPAVGTRKDFHADQHSDERLEEIKLEDGIHHHEYVKVELENYSRSQNVRLVKPFMLVVAQDTEHAKSIRSYIESGKFFDGRYKGRVIEVHSNQSGEESDEAMQRLLALEHDETTEIVIHVNKLKEGWDVTNLYTIVPLRASESEILTEQTIGRGLRLPYGKRTGVEAVDRLCIVAHERFQRVVDEANKPESIIRKTLYIGGSVEDDIPDRRPEVIISRSVAEILVTGRMPEHNGIPVTQDQLKNGDVLTADPRRATVVDLVIRAIHQEAANLPSSRALDSESVQTLLIGRVKSWVHASAPVQQILPGLTSHAPIQEDDDELVRKLVQEVTGRIIELTIDVPQIVVLPTREVNYQFLDFDLERLDRISFQPVSQELLLQHLENNKQVRIQWDSNDAREEQLENYIVRYMVSQDAVDYDEHAELLYKLARQVIDRLRSYLSDESQVENVLVYWQRQLGEFVWTQMQEHVLITPTGYFGKVNRGFDLLRPASFTLLAGDKPRNFREPIVEKRLVRQMVFEGFKKCCYPYQKFQSVEGEWRLAQVLEDDTDVLKWMKPAPMQFRIEYEGGKNYEPDFVVETRDFCMLIEPKRADQINQGDVKAKALAALRWCTYANEHAEINGGKKWAYLLVPDDAINLSRTVAGLRAEFEFKA